jgi:N-acetylmuramoyl-L-alanine amidase
VDGDRLGGSNVGDVAELSELEQLGESELRHPPTEAIELELAGEPAALEELSLEPLAAAAWPISRSCSRRYTAAHNSGRRRLSAIRLLVVHCTQGSTARGAAAWFANPRSQGSAHLCVDGAECYRTLAPSVIPWAAAGCNGSGWHLELAGFAEWSRAQWLAHRSTLNRGAFKIAWHADAFGIPLRLLTPAQVRAGAQGLITHKIASSVYGGSHWDPGPNFPMDVFLKAARHYREGM